MTDPHQYFTEATATLEPDVQGLVAGGLRRGRARRRRRQVLTTLASGGAVAVLALASVGVPQLLRSEAPVQPAGGGGGATESAQEEPTPSGVAPEPAQPRTLAVTPGQVPGVVADVIGGDVETVMAYPGDRDGVVAHFRWDGAYTTVFVDGFLEDRAPLAECRATAAQGMQCSSLPDGSAERQWQEQQPAADGGTTGRGLSLFTVDGWALEVISYNAAEPKSSVQTSPEPPISFDQMRQVVTSDAWFA
ncbi:hypothetical protein GCM10009623_14970 [Nocardioides aestuarii]|uniref:Uncharacterized protein n=1 Tax=Nocardioides aestuarii TaxID=252231 RepID=A0ABW4TLX3_9ACTN